jgi:NADH-quinone oxidoreductase subunit N
MPIMITNELSIFIIVTATIVLTISTVLIRRNHALAASIAFAGQLAALVVILASHIAFTHAALNLFIVDGYAVFFEALILAASMVTVVLSYGYFQSLEDYREEYYILLLLATLGSLIIVASNHFISFFLGLELLSVSLYALIAYTRHSEYSLEAGVKYLILAASSSAFLLFGVALVYAELGTMQFGQIATFLSAKGADASIFLLSGMGLLVVGIGFKLGIVPFHMWTPDVYEGAPAPVTAYLATVSKGAMFALLFRFFTSIQLTNSRILLILFWSISIASMFFGNLLALQQKNIKRILAYSSIAHLGYLLVAFIAGGSWATPAVLFYFTAYFITTLGAFGVISVLSNDQSEPKALEEYRGLFWTRPWIAVLLTASLLSLAGIPLTAGFIAKYFIILSGVDAAQWTLVLVLVVNSAIGLYYYLRVIVTMYSQPAEQEDKHPSLPAKGILVLGTLLAGLLWLGIFPDPLIYLIRNLIAIPVV